jgi:hypothetical protein
MSLPVLSIQPIYQFTQLISVYEGQIALWRPNLDPGWFYFGDYCQPGGSTPVSAAYAVQIESAGTGTPALMPPVDWKLITCNGFVMIGGPPYTYVWYSWLPVPPQNYVACGHVVTVASQTFVEDPYNPPPPPPNIPGLQCLRADLAKSYGLTTQLWTDSGSHFHPGDTALWAISPLNTFFVWPNYDTPTTTAFVPQQQIPEG